jgi:hypothetical protein
MTEFELNNHWIQWYEENKPPEQLKLTPEMIKAMEVFAHHAFIAGMHRGARHAEKVFLKE